MKANISMAARWYLAVTVMCATGVAAQEATDCLG